MLKLKILVIFAVMLISIYFIVNWRIRLGADLRGGSQLTLQIHLQDAFNAEAQETAARLRAAGHDGTVAVENATIRLTGASLNQRVPGWAEKKIGPSEYRLSMEPAEVVRLRQEVVSQTLRVIEKKTNELGLTEATEQIVGAPEDGEILVEMPGVDDTARVKRLLGTAAVLEWLDVKDGPFLSPGAALASRGGVLPLNTQLVESADRAGGCYLLSRNPVIRGMDIRNAQPGQAPMGGWLTTFVLSQDAARRFETYTAANIGKRAAIVLDHQIISVAVIQNKIRDTGQIMGEASLQAASELALNLRAGSLPASVEYVEERTVGPSLGADSIRQGMRAGVAGLAAVVTVMCTYYKGAGVNATVALAINALILVAALSYFGAVLTLPGIAGVILTLGMAVDSNVLIFERIREELRAGQSAIAAVNAGFGKALSSIIDTHVTTVVACGCLFLFGSGPVKGFAVTLVLGLVANVFTAVFVSKVLFDWKLTRPGTVRLSI